MFLKKRIQIYVEKIKKIEKRLPDILHLKRTKLKQLYVWYCTNELSYNCMCDLQDGRGWPTSFVLSQVFTQGFKEVDAEISRPGTQHSCDPAYRHTYSCMYSSFVQYQTYSCFKLVLLRCKKSRNL